MPEEVEAEIEALSFTYDTDLLCCVPNRICVRIKPRTGDGADVSFLQAKLVMDVTTGYPEQQLASQIIDAKGISCARLAELRGRLQQEQDALAGEMILGHLCETAIDYLTEVNCPDGACIFCLEDLSEAATSSTPVFMLPCYHTFHEACFTSWWAWQQQALKQEERELEQHAGANAAVVLKVRTCQPA